MQFSGWSHRDWETFSTAELVLVHCLWCHFLENTAGVLLLDWHFWHFFNLYTLCFNFCFTLSVNVASSFKVFFSCFLFYLNNQLLPAVLQSVICRPHMFFLSTAMEHFDWLEHFLHSDQLLIKQLTRTILHYLTGPLLLAPRATYLLPFIVSFPISQFLSFTLHSLP